MRTRWTRKDTGNEVGPDIDYGQMRRMARLPLSEKLAWLEEAHRLVEHLRRQAPSGPGSIPAKSQDRDSTPQEG